MVKSKRRFIFQVSNDRLHINICNPSISSVMNPCFYLDAIIQTDDIIIDNLYLNKHITSKYLVLNSNGIYCNLNNELDYLKPYYDELNQPINIEKIEDNKYRIYEPLFFPSLLNGSQHLSNIERISLTMSYESLNIIECGINFYYEEDATPSDTIYTYDKIETYYNKEVIHKNVCCNIGQLSNNLKSIIISIKCDNKYISIKNISIMYCNRAGLMSNDTLYDYYLYYKNSSLYNNDLTFEEYKNNMILYISSPDNIPKTENFEWFTSYITFDEEYIGKECEIMHLCIYGNSIDLTKSKLPSIDLTRTLKNDFKNNLL